MNLILLHGENTYESEQKLHSLITELKTKKLKIEVIEGSEVKNINELKLDFDTSLFGENKALVIKNLFQNSSKDLLETFHNFLHEQSKSSHENQIILWENKNADKRTSLYKFVEKNYKTLEFKKLNFRQLNNWIISYCRSNSLYVSESIAYLIMDKAGDNQQILSKEIDKLVVLGKEKISAEDIEEYISDSAEKNIFRLIDGILDLLRISSEKQTNTKEYRTKFSEIQKLAEKLFEDYKTYPSLISNLTSNISTMIRIKYLKEEGVKEGNMLSFLPMNPYVFKKLQERSSYFRLEFLENKFELLAELDYKFKSGKIDNIGMLVSFLK